MVLITTNAFTFSLKFVIIEVITVNQAQWNAGNCMPSGIEVTKAALDDFQKIQEYMLLARKENATETYARLKKEYLT